MPEITPAEVIRHKQPNGSTHYGCPHCPITRGSVPGLIRHAVMDHGPGSILFTSRKGAHKKDDVLAGDTVVIGPTPRTPVTVTVSNGNARRAIVVYVLPMAEVVDLVVGTLRQQAEGVTGRKRS